MLHPQAQALLNLMIERQTPPVHTLEPEAARASYRSRVHLTQPAPPAVASSQDLQALLPDGRALRLRLIRPLGSDPRTPLPALVYLHGGGWVIGDLDTHDTLCRELANGAGCAVVSVDYRLAPEHRFPAAVDDAIEALRWVHTHAGELAIDPDRLAVGGDSAGGNLAAVAALALRDEGLPLRLQLLIYPATDMRQVAPSHERNGQGYLLTRDSMDYYSGHYQAPHTDWRASPLLHTDLSALPPALVITAGYDPLCDEGLQYAQRLSESGVACTHVCFSRQIHGFILMGGVLEEAHDAVALCTAALRRAFRAGGG